MYHIEIILKVIDYKNTKKISNRAIAKLFNLSRTTVNRWIKQYSIELTSLSHRIYNNKVYEKIKANKQLKLDLKTSNLNILQFLITVLNNNPFLSKKELAVILSKQFDIAI